MLGVEGTYGGGRLGVRISCCWSARRETRIISTWSLDM
uniref:Uncharacterized protein n=1 Tax=Ascaris lumbricoides TaxID=6252 RepID=A0A0M3HLR0_ASCLU